MVSVYEKQSAFRDQLRETLDEEGYTYIQAEFSRNPMGDPCWTVTCIHLIRGVITLTISLPKNMEPYSRDALHEVTTVFMHW